MCAACRLVNLCWVRDHGKEVFKDKDCLRGFQNKGGRGRSVCDKSIGVVTKPMHLTFVTQIHKTIFSVKGMFVNFLVSCC